MYDFFSHSNGERGGGYFFNSLPPLFVAVPLRAPDFEWRHCAWSATTITENSTVPVPLPQALSAHPTSRHSPVTLQLVVTAHWVNGQKGAERKGCSCSAGVPGSFRRLYRVKIRQDCWAALIRIQVYYCLILILQFSINLDKNISNSPHNLF